MKVASVELNSEEINRLKDADSLLENMQKHIKNAVNAGSDIIVFPVFTGCLYEMLYNGYETLEKLINNTSADHFIGKIKNLSSKYDISICTGSYWEHDNSVYSTSCILRKGKIILKQRQIYLARWEREMGLSRGVDVTLTDIRGWKVGIVLSTDVFYPQVSRMLAFKGADIILCPIGFIGQKNRAIQLTGVWQEVQQNQFFAVESGFNGRLGDISLWGKSNIHSPLEMTENDDGFLLKNKDKSLIYSQLDNEKRKKAIDSFDVFKQLNKDFCTNMGLFKGDKL